jgi:hypothetical protein
VIERFGVKGTTAGGVFFTEADCPAEGRLLGPVAVSKNRQNWDLVRIKESLAAEALKKGGTAVVSFRYGQRSHKWYQLLQVRWDTESWFGEGEAALLPRTGEGASDSTTG